MTKLPDAVIEAANHGVLDYQIGAEVRARAVIRALAENLPDEAVEAAARELCTQDCQYAPDDLDKIFMCDANDDALPAWRWYEDEALLSLRAALLKVAGGGDET